MSANSFKWSIMYYPDDPVDEYLEIARAADELGYYALYLTDSSLRKDLWVLLGAAARETKQLHLGPNAARVFMRDPVMVAQAVATLDELSGGRADVVIGTGIDSFLQMHNIPVSQARKNSGKRLEEAVLAMQQFLAEGRVDFQGDIYQYNGIVCSARPRQQPLPVKIGHSGGKMAMELSGRVADGMHIAPVGTRRSNQVCVDRAREAAQAAGRDPNKLDLATVPIMVCAEDGEAARQIARIKTAWYLPVQPKVLVELVGLTMEQVAPIGEAWNQGQYARAVELVTPEMVDALGISGTPDEVVQGIKDRIVGTGINHIVVSTADTYHARQLVAGQMEVKEIPDIKGQLRLIQEKVMPAFA